MRSVALEITKESTHSPTKIPARTMQRDMKRVAGAAMATTKETIKPKTSGAAGLRPTLALDTLTCERATSPTRVAAPRAARLISSHFNQEFIRPQELATPT